MMTHLREFIEKAATEGIKFPSSFDPNTEKASPTLFFTHLSFGGAMTSVMALHFFPSVWPATSATLILWVLAMVFWRMHDLDSFKINLREQEITLTDEEEEEKK